MTERKRKKGAYTGVLAKPIKLKMKFSGKGVLDFEYDNHSAIEEAKTKIPLLFEHYGLPYIEDELSNTPANIRALLFCLAIKHVKGFRIVHDDKKLGRPKKRSFAQNNKLIERVETLSKEHRKSVSWACLEIAKKKEFGGLSKGAIETWYYEAKKSGGALRLLASLLRDGSDKDASGLFGLGKNVLSREGSSLLATLGATDSDD